MPNYHGQYEGAFPRSIKVNGKWDGHRLYKILQGVIYRCNNRNQIGYEYYGGRGIKVYEEWNNLQQGWAKFSYWVSENFPNIEELLEQGYEIDRINVHGNYEPGNIRFVHPLINQQNKQKTLIVKWIDGQDYPFSELYHKYGNKKVRIVTARSRYVKFGWDIERALTETTRLIKRRKAPETVNVEYLGEVCSLRGLVLNFSLLSYDVVAARVRRGWDVEKALITPVKNTGSKRNNFKTKISRKGELDKSCSPQ